MTRQRTLLASILLVFGLLSGCSASNQVSSPAALVATETAAPTLTATATALPSATPTATLPPLSTLNLWVAPYLPEKFVASLNLPADLKQTSTPEQANFKLDVLSEEQDDAANWVYTLVAPFPTLTDNVNSKDLISLWKNGQTTDVLQKPLLMDASTQSIFEKVWGPAADGSVEVVDTKQLLETAWEKQTLFALVPFEALEPRWKVIKVDQKSPFDRNFEFKSYPLVVKIGLNGQPEALASLKQTGPKTLFSATNFNPEHQTALLLTGTTAMVRYMALRMEENGVLYPLSDIKSIFDSADITHISNEVPFYEKCPPAKPVRREMRFCSDPKYFELLQKIGTDVIEMTGNHILDWGPDPLLYTLDLYDQNGLKYYGGGRNDQDARKPLVVEDHGNKIGFIGCSPAGPASVWATATQPGSAKCDFEYINEQIQMLLTDGVVPIFTFQHYESDDYRPTPMQRPGDFKDVSAMGAVIVSGSQSHFPQAMTFSDGRFIHYGLGNTFFDQMDDYHRQAFLDRHIIYEGRYISTELVTITLEDYARPRLMTPEERDKFLQTVFAASIWK